MKHLAWIAIALFVMLPLFSCSSDSTGPGGGGDVGGDYVVFAWNNLGMHCLNDTYDQAVILPPYNTLWAQVVLKGNPPEIVTSGVTVDYAIDVNTYSYGKRSYGQFWDNAVALFGPLLGITSLPHDIGLTGIGLSGKMTAAADHFIAEGIPVTPVNDAGQWNPYQAALITVRSSGGTVLAQTRATVPVSDEINCAKCHGQDAWHDVLLKHDQLHTTNLLASTPVLCASCHGSPALGTSGPGTSGIYLSKAIHGAHASRGAVCYDCHPGPATLCNRSVRHSTTDGNCTTCHGTIDQVASTIPGARIPWVNEPSCVSCHTGVAGVATGFALYRDAPGHGGLYCATCHGSPHAMYPSRLALDNYQPLQYQNFTGKVKTLGSCGVCHDSSRGEGVGGEFSEVHGGTGPERKIGCHMCHTVVPTETSKWPHAYEWKNSNG
ncbi:MAG: hypothetical protein H6Q78_1713 [Candidatus Krumholzibacteriota bacterium]|nr:hypothetical protein [Candidatus Krumholzibacteriota bacterium]